MKKLVQLLAYSLFLISLTTNAQSDKVKGNGKITTETRKTADYDLIKISGSFDVDLVSGKEGTISIKGDENLMPLIKVEVEDNTLKIYTQKNSNIRPSQKIQVVVPFDKISELSLSGSGNIQTKNNIKSDKFSAKLSGSGNFNLGVESNDFDLNLSGSGNVHLKGTANNFSTKLSGSGDITATDLKSKNVDVNVSGSGNSRVNCNENLTARVSGSGNIKYSGNPEKRDVKVSGSGNISKA